MRLPTDNFRNPSAVARFFLVCAIGVALDLWTKAYAFSHLALGDAPPDNPLPRHSVFIPGWLQFEITKNFGAVFGIGQGRKWLFLGVSVLAIGFLSYLFATSKRQRFYQFVLGMLLAGVLGNMYDRIVFGYVRDMIHALPGWHWPGQWQAPVLRYPGDGRDVFPFIFNVADILLCVGVGLMIVYSLFTNPAKEKAASPAATPAPQT
jgi:signal peptidase II